MIIDYNSYDLFLVAFSGGKDSIACVLHLLEQGVHPSKIELHHTHIDGDRHSDRLMDWNITESYCRAFAAAFSLPIYFNWKIGGFKGEMLRENSLTAPTVFEDKDYVKWKKGGTWGKKSTRRKFPQVSASLKVRWCSSLKIDALSLAINNQKRFFGIKTCVISGERGEESPNRAKYHELEPDRCDLRNGVTPRHVDRHRPVLQWKEAQVWAIIERWRVRPHPAYLLGFNRVSCLFCIFGNADQFASAYAINAKQGDQIIAYEKEFGVTIKRNKSLPELMGRGRIYDAVVNNPELVELANAYHYAISLILSPNEVWVTPPGAFGEGCGPQ